MKEDKTPVPRFTVQNGFSTTPQRSKLMSKIKGKDTTSELALRKALWGLGIRYRKNYRELPGNPDIVIRKFKIVIFIDGDFWHGFDWERKKDRIKSNKDFWVAKIERNMQRDKANNEMLKKHGWKVLRFWDHEIKTEFGVCLSRILDLIREETMYGHFHQ